VNSAEVARQALVIGVSRFGPEPPDCEEAELTARHPLPYAAELTPKVAEVLGRFGYVSALLTAPQDTTADALGRWVRRGSDDHRLSPDGVRVVFVLSHGELSEETDGLFVVGSDGQTCGETDVAFWLSDVTTQKTTHPMTLFLLDVCHGGQAARLTWQLKQADGSGRAWVIAASAPDRKAYDGRFTQALIEVLTDIADGEMDINPTVEFIPFDTVAKKIQDRVITLSVDKSEQRIAATMLDASVSPKVAFFPNPHYHHGAIRDRVDAALAAFSEELDTGLDPGHFTSRAAGLGPFPGLPRTGHFRGRETQLRTLSQWMDQPDDADTLRVVTGAPGAGKSALLGVLVCAAHPQLRIPTRHLWERQRHISSENPDLIAVHARERTTSLIAASILRQLGATRPSDSVDGADMESASVLDVLDDRTDPPLIVLDALDEAVATAAVLQDLVLPLIRARRPDGRPAARLLVGTRTGPEWPQIEPLLAAVANNQVIDLDHTPREVLRDDLGAYLDDVLRTRPPYTQAALAGTRRRIADGIAERLVIPTHGPGRRWGEFLVAGLFAHQLLTRPTPPTSPEQVEVLLAHVPTTLPGVLEMDLAGRPGDDMARPLLTALAHAKGDGIPLSLLAVLIPVFSTSGLPVTIDAVLDGLAGNRFYLHFSVDSDGTTLYRLFHQGLIDYLLESRPIRRRAATVSSLLDQLLATVRVTGRRRRWDLTVPYLGRHVMQHAGDAGRAVELLTDHDLLVYANPDAMLAALWERDDSNSQLLAALYRSAYQPRRWSLSRTRRSLLAMEAARFRVEWGAEWCTDPSDEPTIGWHPIWATGSQISSSMPPIFTGILSGLVACTFLGTRMVAVTGGHDGTVRIWDLATGTPIGDPLTGHRDWVTALACTVIDDRPVAVTAGGHDGTVRIWDLTTGTPIDDRPVAVTAGGHDGTARIWDLTTGTPIGDPLTGHRDWVTALACTVIDGRPVAVTGGHDKTVRIWDLATGTPIGDPLTGHRDWVTALACTVIDGRPVAVTGGHDKTVRIWDLTTGTPIGDPLTGHTDSVESVVCEVIHGYPVAVTASRDKTVRIWDLVINNPVGDPLTGHGHWVTAVAGTVIDDRPVAVTAGGHDGTVRIWDLATGTPIGDPLTGHTDSVTAVACTVIDDRPVAVTSSNDKTVRLWDLYAHIPIGSPTDLPEAGYSVAFTHDGDLIVGFGWDVALLRTTLSLPRQSFS
jgi:WD40 repeat protein